MPVVLLLLLAVLVCGAAGSLWIGLRIVRQVYRRQPPALREVVVLGLSLAVTAYLVTAAFQLLRSGLHSTVPGVLLVREQLLVILLLAVGPAAVLFFTHLHLSGRWPGGALAAMAGAAGVTWLAGLVLLAVSVGCWPTLTWAVCHGSTSTAQVLLALGLDPEGNDRRTGRPLLMTAVLRGDTAMAGLLLAAGADPDLPGSGWQPLLDACGSGNSELAGLLLEAGADPDLVDPHGRTALMAACRSGDLPLARTLLAAGGQPPGGLEQALVAAVAAGDQQAVEQLLARLVRRHLLSPGEWERELLAAAAAGSRPRAEEALAVGTAVDCTDAIGRTPLIKAARHGAAEVAALLLSHGAAVDTADHNGQTALLAAASGGEPALVDLLLSHGAAIDARDTAGRTALLVAAEAGQVATVELLLARGASRSAVNRRGDGARALARAHDHLGLDQLLARHGVPDLEWHEPTPEEAARAARDRQLDGRVAGSRRQLLLAISAGDTATVDRLLSEGGEVTAHDSATNGGTALTWAAYCGQLQVVRLLLAAGAEVDGASEAGVTALMEAAKGGYSEVAELLLDHGAAVDARTGTGWTALMWASERGYAGLVEMLLAHGADPSPSDDIGRTALSAARAAHHDEVVQLLAAHAAQ